MTKVIVKKINNLYTSNGMYVIAIVFLAIGSLLQMISFLNGNPIIYGGGKEALASENQFGIASVLILLPFIGFAVQIFGIILAVQNRKVFIYGVVAGNFLLIIYMILIGGGSYAILSVYSIVISISQYKNGRDEKKLNNVMNTKKGIASLSICVIVITVGLTLTLTGVLREERPVLDVLGTVSLAYFWYLMLNKNKYAFFGFLFVDTMYFILFAVAGLWITATSFIFYIFFNLTALIYGGTRDIEKFKD